MLLTNVFIRYTKISPKASPPDVLFESLAEFLYGCVQERLRTSTEQDILSLWLEEDIFSDEEGISGATEDCFWLTFTRCGAGIGAHWFTLAKSRERLQIERLLERHGYEWTERAPGESEPSIEEDHTRWFFFILDARSCGAKTACLAEVSVDTRGRDEPQIIIPDWKDVSVGDLTAADRDRLLACIKEETCDCSMCKGVAP